MDPATQNISWRGPLAAVASILILLIGLAPGIAEAARAAGRVISANGDVTAVRPGESARSLDFDQVVNEGDEIRTGPDGSVQISFYDGGLVALESSSRFAIDRYGPDEDGDGSSAVMRFLAGALRTLTGSISDQPEDTYRVKTNTATIGVRGTGYSLEYCNASCALIGDGAPGLYGRVDEGVIVVTTDEGGAEFRAGDFVFVPGLVRGAMPQLILEPPGGVLDTVSRDPGVGASSTVALDLPPGLAMMDALPPGLAKREELPPGLANRESGPPGLDDDGPPGLNINGPPGLNGMGPPGLNGMGPPGLNGNGKGKGPPCGTPPCGGPPT